MFRRAILIGFLAVVCARGIHAQTPAPWWNDQWKYRCRIDIPPGLKKSDIAWAKFIIPEGIAPDGADLRLIDQNGRAVRHQIQFWEPSLYAIVAMDAAQGTPPYYLYMGNPSAERPAKGWQARAGLFLSTWKMEGEEANNPRQMRQMILNSSWAYGGGYRGNIFDGLNPFGAPDRYVSFYRGYLNISREGQYTFATVSDDASALMIDGKPVATWFGEHEVQGGARGQHNGKVNLSEGIHRLEYFHCDFGGPQTAVAAWMRPGETTLSIIQPSDFVAIHEAVVGPLMDHRLSVIPQWNLVQQQYWQVADDTFTIYRFSVDPATLTSDPAECRWEFSDGIRARGKAFSRVFLREKDYSVRMTLTEPSGKKYSAERVFRVAAIDKADLADEQERKQEILQLALAMPLNALSALDAAAAARLLVASNRPAEAAKLCESILARSGKNDDISEVAKAYLALSTGKPEDAIARVRKVIANSGDTESAVRLQMQVARVAMEVLHQNDDALFEIKAAELRFGKLKSQSDALRRELLVTKGDILRRLGKAPEATEAYTAAEAIPLAGMEYQPFDISSYALTAESHLTRNELDEAAKALAEWESKYPTEKMVGYTSVLRARLLLRQKKPAESARELEIFLLNQPAGVFAKQGRIELAEIYENQKQHDKARTLYHQLQGDYQDPQTTAAAKAGLERTTAGDHKRK